MACAVLAERAPSVSAPGTPADYQRLLSSCSLRRFQPEQQDRSSFIRGGYGLQRAHSTGFVSRACQLPPLYQGRQRTEMKPLLSQGLEQQQQTRPDMLKRPNCAATSLKVPGGPPCPSEQAMSGCCSSASTRAPSFDAEGPSSRPGSVMGRRRTSRRLSGSSDDSLNSCARIPAPKRSASSTRSCRTDWGGTPPNSEKQPAARSPGQASGPELIASAAEGDDNNNTNGNNDKLPLEQSSGLSAAARPPRPRTPGSGIGSQMRRRPAPLGSGSGELQTKVRTAESPAEAQPIGLREATLAPWRQGTSPDSCQQLESGRSQPNNNKDNNNIDSNDNNSSHVATAESPTCHYDEDLGAKLSSGEAPDTFELWAVETFRQWDKDGDGKLSVLELGTMLRSQGIHLDYEAARRALELVAGPGATGLRLSGFLKLVAQPRATATVHVHGCSEDRVSLLQRVFAAYDTNRTGRLETVEVSALLSDLGRVPRTRSESQELSLLIASCRKDELPGPLSFDEFLLLARLLDADAKEDTPASEDMSEDTVAARVGALQRTELSRHLLRVG
ncbi:unnamed protein product [Polarella glacialis]|uniref:EF-hand domain-containing protein n=1 Tax=Polarella glacialis TaxID=89957 RepID=A0A813FCU8_POLGL|nr:unnamed protein product [Polarella glacialis]CAE8675067.1 unnamed protein product [Polarella glacialis]